MIRLFDPQGLAIFMHCPDEFFSQLRYRLAKFARPLNDLVVYIGNIAHIGQVIARLAQVACHDIKDHQHTDVTKMQIVVHRDAAYIHADTPLFQWRKHLLATGQ